MNSTSPNEDQPLLPQINASRFGEPHFLSKLLATSFNYFITGIIVTALGALIPSIESYHGISDSQIAAIFPCTVAGYLCSTLSIQYVHFRLGRLGVGYVSSILRLIALVLLSAGPSFSFCLLAFAILGFGTGLTDSGWSAWAANLKNPNIVQGPLHGAFGVGCILGPVIAVALIDRRYSWYDIYRIVAVLVIIELIGHIWAFWECTAQQYQEILHDDRSKNVDSSSEEAISSAPVYSSDANVQGGEDYQQSNECQTTHTSVASNPFRYRGTWMCAAFFFIYVSIEFTYSDWIVVYMRRARDTPYTTAGLASSIFWLGMSIGRIALAPVSEHFGVKCSVMVYLSLSAFFQIFFKLAQKPTLSLCVLGFNGLMLGPTFPSGLVLLSRSVPQHAQVGAVAVAAAAGQIGAATIPYGIGFMAEAIGIGRLLDVVLALTFTLLTTWFAYCRLC
jgi:fucose permease